MEGRAGEGAHEAGKILRARIGASAIRSLEYFPYGLASPARADYIGVPRGRGCVRKSGAAGSDCETKRPPEAFPLEGKVGGFSRSDEARNPPLWQMQADTAPMRQRVLLALALQNDYAEL